MITPVTLLQGDNIDAHVDYRDALPVNMLPVVKQILGAGGYMRTIPGLRIHSEGIGADRGGMYNDRSGTHYRVSGGSLVSVSPVGVVSVLGSVLGTTQAAMPYSFNTQAIVADGRFYLHGADGFRRVTDGDVGSPIDAVWVDGYYFLTDGEYLYHTELSDESSIDPLAFATAEFMPDPSLGLAKTSDNKVVVFGRYSMEYFVNASTENFGFRRVETRAQKIGIVATHAKTETAGVFFIVGGRKGEALGVHAVTVGRADKISTRTVDQILAGYTEPELADIRVESRAIDGTNSVIVHLPGETLVYSVEAGTWGEMRSSVSRPYRGTNGVFDALIGKWVYGDKYGGNIGILDPTIYKQYDDPATEWILYSPFVDMERMSIDEIEIETIPGWAIDKNNTVFLSLTYDGVHHGTEARMDYGGPGDYGTRFIKRRLGYVSDWPGFKFRSVTSSPMAFGLFTVTHG